MATALELLENGSLEIGDEVIFADIDDVKGVVISSAGVTTKHEIGGKAIKLIYKGGRTETAMGYLHKECIPVGHLNNYKDGSNIQRGDLIKLVEKVDETPIGRRYILDADVGAKAVVLSKLDKLIEIKWINTKSGKGLRNGQNDGLYNPNKFVLLERMGKSTGKHTK